MDINKINENLENFKIDDLELSADNLSEIEIEAIKKKLKKEIKKPRKKGKIVAAVAVIAITGTIFTPAVAKNIPFINEMYKSLGFFDGYEEYTKYIGETKESNGYEVTVDNIVGTQNNIIFSFKIKSPVKINDDELGTIISTVSLDYLNSDSSGGEVSTKRVDDYTVIQRVSVETSKPTIKNKGNFKIYVSKHEIETLKEEMNVDFNLNLDFTDSFKDTKFIKVNKKINKDRTINELMVTRNKVTLFGLGNADLRKVHTSYVLDVDGVFYSSYGCLSGEEEFTTSFENLNIEKFNNAKSVELIEIALPSTAFQEGKKSFNKYKDGKENGINYPKEIINSKGEKGEIYKLERDGTKVNIYLSAEYDSLILVPNLNLSMYDEESKNLEIYYSKTIKSEDGYILEFNDVDKSMDLNLVTISGSFNIADAKISERIKIK